MKKKKRINALPTKKKNLKTTNIPPRRKKKSLDHAGFENGLFKIEMPSPARDQYFGIRSRCFILFPKPVGKCKNRKKIEMKWNERNR